MPALRPLFQYAAPGDILRALAHVRASQDRRSSAISLYRRATTARASSYQSDASQRHHGKTRDDPLTLCGLAQLLLTPYRRRRARPPVSPLPQVGRDGGDGETSTADGAGGGGGGGVEGLGCHGEGEAAVDVPNRRGEGRGCAAPRPRVRHRRWGDAFRRGILLSEAWWQRSKLR